MDFAVDIKDGHTTIFKRGQGIVLRESNHGAICGGRVVSLDTAKRNFISHFKRVNPTSLQKTCLFCISCSLESSELEKYKSVAYSADVAVTEFIPSVLASAVSMGYDVMSKVPCVSVEINEGGTEIAVILGAEIVMGGSVDAGVGLATQAIKYHLLQKNMAEISDLEAHNVFFETATLLENDEVSYKIENVGYFSGTTCFNLIYKTYTDIARAVLQIIGDCQDNIREALFRGGVVYVGGVGVAVTGIREFFTLALNMAVEISSRGAISSIIGAGALLKTPAIIRKIANSN